MARKPRVHYPGALYHAMSRGNQGQLIFLDDGDRQRYLNLLKELPRRFGCKLYAYVLMDNHVHLLVEVGNLPLSKIMQNLQFRYTQQYNRRYRKVGHLFQGRYKAILCDRDNYLLELVRYIHLNPIRAGLVRRTDRYRWSSHAMYVKGDETQGVSVNTVLEQFGSRRRGAIQRYREFISEGMGEGHREDLYQTIDQRFLGDEEFAQEIRERVEEVEDNPPIDIELEEIVKKVCGEFGIHSQRVLGREKSREISEVRWMIGRLAIEQAGYRLMEVARYLNRDPGVMSRGIRHIEERLEQDKQLSRRIGKLQVRMREGRKTKIARRQA